MGCESQRSRLAIYLMGTYGVYSCASSGLYLHNVVHVHKNSAFRRNSAMRLNCTGLYVDYL